MNIPVSNPNDHKVVSFHNSTDFGFTPDMGCMFDGKGINGKHGSPGIDAGETVVLPYHIAHQLALNLAKILMTRQAPAIDPAGIPTGVPLWDTVKLERMKNSFLRDLYTEEKPTTVSETDKLMAKVEEYRKVVDDLLQKHAPAPAPVQTEVSVPVTPITPPPVTDPIAPKVYRDKQEVIAELEKRGIKHDKRKSKDDLEKLLAPVTPTV